jgi:hypothetical protein
VASRQAVEALDSGEVSRRLATIAGRLEDLLGERLLAEPRQLSSGASRDTYRIATASRGELVVQLERRKAKLGGGPPPQAALLKAAAEAGVPVARRRRWQ